MSKEVSIIRSDSSVVIPHVSLDEIGLLANSYAARIVFSDYLSRISANTKRRQSDDLALFTDYLAQVHIARDVETLMSMPESWQGITHGLVAGFVQYQLREGYAIGSINVRLSTIKRYCSLAAQAGAISSETMGLIKLIKGFRHKEGRNVDEQREQTRIEKSKKAEPVSIAKEIAEKLKHEQPNTPQGRRDALLMCLLFDHGLRCGEIAELQASNLNLQQGVLVFYRRKVDKVQTHELTRDTLLAAQRYLASCSPESSLLMGSRKGGELKGRMSERAITDRVRVLCERLGVDGASAHDGRHAFVTYAIRGGTDLKSLQDAGGWNSIAMPARYAESQRVANKGVRLG